MAREFVPSSNIELVTNGDVLNKKRLIKLLIKAKQNIDKCL